jgi:hypothetical protein
VPTGIVTAEMTAQHFRSRWISGEKCQACGLEGHEEDTETAGSAVRDWTFDSRKHRQAPISPGHMTARI